MKGPWFKPWTSRSWQFQENGGQMSPIGVTASTAWPRGTEGLLKQEHNSPGFDASKLRQNKTIGTADGAVLKLS
jgi:hypothetical protein